MTEALIGNGTLVDAIYQLQYDSTLAGLDQTFQSIHPAILNESYPQYTISEITYEKGFQLFAFLETLIGYEGMQDFLTYYVYNNYMQSVDNFQVMEIFREFLPTVANGNATLVNEILGQIDWE